MPLARKSTIIIAVINMIAGPPGVFMPQLQHAAEKTGRRG